MSELIQSDGLKEAIKILEAKIAQLEAITQASGENIRTLAARVQALEDEKTALLK